MSDMEPVRWGVLSTSMIATKRVIPAMQQSSLLKVAAIASRNLDSAQEHATRLGVPRAYGSYEELLADPAIEVVYIPLPNPMHVEWSIKAMEAGKHVLCEKPVAMNAQEAERLIPVRDRTGKLIEEGFPFVNHPQWHFIRKTIADDVIGKVRGVTAMMAYNNMDPANLRNRPDMGGGALYDAGCYVIQAVRLTFAAEPVRVMALFDIDPNFGTDRMISATLEFKEGHATFICSTQAGPTTGGSHQQFGVLGGKGWLRADFPFSHSTPSYCRISIGDTASLGGLPAREEAFNAVNQYQLQAERFSRLVRGQKVEAFPIENAVANMKVIDALFRSGKSKNWETV